MNKLAIAVAKGSSVRAAARALAIPERTGKRLAKLAEFQPSVIKFREQINAQVIDRYRVRLLKNLDRLNAIIDNPANEAETVVKAIRGATADFMALSGHIEMAEKLVTLEARFAEIKPTAWRNR